MRAAPFVTRLMPTSRAKLPNFDFHPPPAVTTGWGTTAGMAGAAGTTRAGRVRDFRALGLARDLDEDFAFFEARAFLDFGERK